MQKIKSILNYILHVREKSKVINKSGLYTSFTLISAYALIMSIVCFVKANMMMGIANIIIALVMMLIMLVFTKIKSTKMLAWFVVTFLYGLMVFFMYYGGVGGVSIMWLLFVPVAGMALINLYYGAIISLLLGISVPLYMLTPLHHLGYQYSEDYRIRFPIIYWAFFIMSLVIFIRIDRFEEEQKALIIKADRANRSKSDFLANMSHEIRTPMNAIMGLCELNMNEDISPIVMENSESIYRSGKSLMNIINDLLDFSKIESGRMELQCNQYKLSDVLNDVIYMTVARMGNKDLEFVVDCDPDIPDLLYGDEVRIKQIMINLLTNALKYTQKGGFLLTLSHRKEEYGINLSISVKDSGIGIKKENIRKIFDAYGRVDAEKNYAIEGTGLGLPITKKLIKLMNGVMRVKSEYGRGTEFTVVIPQKVMDEKPIVSLSASDNVNILYYSVEKLPEFIGQSFRNSFTKVIKKMNATGHTCLDFEDFKKQISEGAYSHLIIGRSEYLENKAYFDELAKSYCMAIIQNRTAPVAISENAVSIYKPFYTLNYSEFINKKALSKEKKKASGSFAAPDAQILVVDDNSLNLKVVTGHMKLYGIQADTAMSGKEAIEMIREKKYDIVFMDHFMPDMDGVETHRAIRLIEKDYIEKMPVIALTANVADETSGLFEQEGFQDFMSKPIQSNIMKEMLLKWLREDLIVKKE